MDDSFEPATVREPAPAVAHGTSGRFAHAGRPVPSFPRRLESTRAEAAGELPYKRDAAARVQGWSNESATGMPWSADGFGCYTCVLGARPPLLVTSHPDLAALASEYETHGYWYLGSRGAEGPLLALRYNLEEMHENCIAVGVGLEALDPAAVGAGPDTLDPAAIVDRMWAVLEPVLAKAAPAPDEDRQTPGGAPETAPAPSVPRGSDDSEPATVRAPAPAVVQGASGQFAHAGRPLPSFPRRRESTRAEAARDVPYKRGGSTNARVCTRYRCQSGSHERQGSRFSSKRWQHRRWSD